jgi:hypothetical protein
MADFSVYPWGILRIVNDKVDLDRPKAFNRARLMLHSGANMFRILRRGVWSIDREFDWETPGYWELFREYIQILHDPSQENETGVGAKVLVEIFDGCSEDWMFDPANYGKARKLVRAMFANLGDLPYVLFGAGNEMNHRDNRAFVNAVTFPEFKKAGRVPYSYGAMYSENDDYLEDEKYDAGNFWSDDVKDRIVRQVHGVKDASSINLIHSVEYWVVNGNPLAVHLGCDGVFDGGSPCDYYGNSRRPSPEQINEAMRYFFANAPKILFPDKSVKYGWEYLPKAVNQDNCSAQGVVAMSQAYSERFGTMPENYGKYPNDWAEPEPPSPIPDPTPQPKTCKGKYIANRPWWKWQILKFIKCWMMGGEG